MQVMSHKFMGNLHLRFLCDVTTFFTLEIWCIPPPTKLGQFYPASLSFSRFRLLGNRSGNLISSISWPYERRWDDDEIVSLLVWLAAMMAKSVLALSDHLPNIVFFLFDLPSGLGDLFRFLKFSSAVEELAQM
jgi:hypothetical protein